MAKAPNQDTSDGEERRLGEQTGLDRAFFFRKEKASMEKENSINFFFKSRKRFLKTRVVLCSKLCRLGVALASSECSAEGKPFSLPLGEYGRKIET